jgi:hypothetical protein
MEFKESFKKATAAYEINKTIIEKQFDGTLYSLELQKNELNDLFDKSACTDLLFKTNNGLLYGIALRINFYKNNFSCVTIRYTRANNFKTEYEKTIESIKNKSINSYYGLQLDVDKELKLIRGVRYNRNDLFRYIYKNHEIIVKNNKQEVYDGNTFLRFTYEDLIKNNIEHVIFLSKI